ncbi:MULTISPECIES: carbohydrate ABC transporter permease [Paenibacillus]|jgi:ABC-type glycerol-3-phosphate transport system permease component|uniref:carbohydrate ABC transporter permease n=1 Tax=Paenibacillus TaxID=44249 RepID=UPI0003A380FD|nr:MULTISPECIES: carbohydrate ABC transporter permease [Paenibacillus]MDU2242320.1 carbohydrate ABC transporter permease [Paenibacillus sp.]
MKKHYAEKSALYLLLLLFVVLFLFPIYWAVTTSFKSVGQIMKVPPEFFPSQWVLGNYVEVFTEHQIGTYFLNSLIVAVTTTVCTCFVATFAGYGFSRFRFKGKAFWQYAIIVMRMVPGLVFIIPYYIIFQKLGILDTLFGLIIVYITASLPLAIWLFMGFFDELPTEMFEASRIDGCSEFGTYWRIALPLIVPGIVVASILVFLAAYNEFSLSLVLVFTDQNKTLPLGISGMIQLQKDTPFGTLAAAGTIAFIPALILALTTQKYVQAGITAGAVKG